MTKFLMAIAMILTMTTKPTYAAVEKKFRAPASLNCGDSRAMTSLSRVIYDLNVQGTIKQVRYEKFMNAVPKAKSCDEILELGIETIGDCTDKDLIKHNCRE